MDIVFEPPFLRHRLWNRGRIKKLIKGYAGNGAAFLFEKETEYEYAASFFRLSL